jgi:uncharacterized iron-regulated membrane protein
MKEFLVMLLVFVLGFIFGCLLWWARQQHGEYRHKSIGALQEESARASARAREAYAKMYGKMYPNDT